MGNRPQALILGIDGGSLEVIEPMIADGLMPRLAALLDASVFGPTTTTWPAHTAPGWATFVTARQPGGHGIYQFFGTQEPDYGDRLLGTGDYGCSTLWQWLARQGRTLGLINVPMSHPPVDLPGYQVTWPLVPTLRYSRPDGLLAELSAAGAPFLSDLVTMYQGDLGYAEFAVRNLRARARSIGHLLRTRPVDVVMTVLTELDRVCHHYWHFADAGHPQHEPAPVAEYAQAIRATGAALDELIGEMLDAIGDETTVLVVSDHGFGRGRTNVAVNSVLAEAGLLNTRPGPASYASWFSDGERSVDFGRTTAYMPTPGCYAVNVNLDGRQQLGRVRPADLAAVTRDLEGLFLGLIDPDTGTSPFRAVLPRAEAYPGPCEDTAPDLLLVPADEGVLAHPHLGEIWSPSQQTGMHRHEGMWALRSATVETGRRAEPVALHDLAPTLLRVLGLQQPAGVLGRPIEAVAGHLSPLNNLPDEPENDRTPGTEYVRDDGRTAEILSAMGYL